MRRFFVCIAAALVMLLSACEMNVNVGVTTMRSDDKWTMTYALFNSSKEENFYAESGDVFVIKTENSEGEICLTVKMKNSDPIYQGNIKSDEFTVNITESGRYTVRVEGEKAKGKFETEKRSKNAEN